MLGTWLSHPPAPHNELQLVDVGARVQAVEEEWRGIGCRIRLSVHHAQKVRDARQDHITRTIGKIQMPHVRTSSGSRDVVRRAGNLLEQKQAGPQERILRAVDQGSPRVRAKQLQRQRYLNARAAYKAAKLASQESPNNIEEETSAPAGQARAWTSHPPAPHNELQLVDVGARVQTVEEEWRGIGWRSDLYAMRCMGGILGQVNMFRVLDDEQFMALVQVCCDTAERRIWGEGEAVLTQWEPAPGCFFVVGNPCPSYICMCRCT